jgi:hypothetical protein
MAPGHEYEILDFDTVKLRENQKEVRDALETLFNLLEDYAPMWYAEEHHQQARSALSARRQQIS